eukprot:11579758-Karenia_brevis.AAC.1
MAKEGQCAKLLKTMYGTQDAAHIWQNSYTRVLQDGGFIVGKGSMARLEMKKRTRSSKQC